MAAQTKGFCKYCGKEYARTGIVRHLAACKERKHALEQGTGKRRCGCYQLFITDRYNSDYWLVIEIKDMAKLSDLDKFLRDIWLECCGHLSSFTIDGQQYDAVPYEDSLWEEPAESMNITLKKVFSPGMVIQYEYDFGSTTELVIKVQDHRMGAAGSEPVTILSRNQQPEIFCCHCKKRLAQWVDSLRYFEEDAFWCDTCLQENSRKEMEEEGVEEEDIFYSDMYESLLPVCNSPRMGVCAYEGSDTYPEHFEPDKK